MITTAAYAAYPYLALYRLGQAIRQGDAEALTALVDWDELREGIKEDICDTLVAPSRADNELPPFGASFVKGIASSAIDHEVTPAALVSAAQTYRPEPPNPASPEDQPRITWAFFDGPGSFNIHLQTPDPEVKEPVRIRMELKGGLWKVTRAWLPPELLSRANEKT